MTKLLVSLAAVSLLASPAFAQMTNTMNMSKTTTTKTTRHATHARKTIARNAKKEGESPATEKKEVKAARHHGRYHRCGTSHMRGHHAVRHHGAKTTKTLVAKGKKSTAVTTVTTKVVPNKTTHRKSTTKTSG